MNEPIAPYYDSGGVTIYLGDSRDLLPLLTTTADAVVTDPPYNIGTPQRITDTRSADKPLIGGDFGVFDNGAVTPAEWVPMARRLMRRGGVLLAFYGSRSLDRLLLADPEMEVIQDFHWCKSNAPVPMRKVGFSWATETGYAMRRRGERHRVNTDAGFSPNWFSSPVCGGAERTDHPTQKPLSVMLWLIRHWTFPGDLVLDPFAGTGTTLVAAKQSGCRAVGIERDRRWCDVAASRLEQSVIPFAELRSGATHQLDFTEVRNG